MAEDKDKLVTLDGLKAVYDNLDGKSNDIKSAIISSETTLFTDPMYLRHGYINTDGVWKSVTSSTLGHRIYPVNAGDFVSITANADKNTRVAVLTSDSAPIKDAQAPVSADASFSGTDITKGTTWTGTMPSDAKWLYVNTQYTDSMMPSAISVNGRDILHSVWDDTVAAIASAISDYGTNANGLFSGLAFGTATAITATEQSPADYNDYTTAGNYYAATTSVVQYINNKPPEVTAAHRLFVLATTAASRIIQIVITNAASVNVYKRYYNGTSWSSWTKLLDDTVIPFDEKAANAKTISANENINEYIFPGNYKVASATTAAQITGLPVAIGGRLTVFTTSAESLVYQIYIRQDSTTGMYIRYATVSDITDPTTASWTQWKRIMTDDALHWELSTELGSGYWALPKSEWSVGNLNSAGEYSSNAQYRICTPNIQIALTKTMIRPREGYRVAIRLFTNGVQTESLSPGTEGAILDGGQEYKLIVRVSPEDTSAIITVNDLYDKAMLFTMVQSIDNIAITEAPEFVHADYGLVPCGVFYPGVSDTYNAFTYDSTASDVYSAFDALVTANSNYVARTDLGVCSDGQQHVYMYDFNPLQKSGGIMFDDIPTVFLLCGQHGYEKASVFSAYYMLKHMMENPTENPVLNYLRNHCRILCIPVANPYGFNQKIYKNYNGVNLNRNWDAEGWGQGEGEQDPSSKDYAGTEPFSEPETQEIRDAFLANKSSICLAVDYHTNGANTPVPNFGEINAILYADNLTPIWNQFKRAVRYHIKDVTSHFRTEYSLNVPENEFCGGTIISAIHGGMAGRWFTDQNKVSCIFETFPGFPGGQTYTPDVIKASEELISNFIITVFNYIKGA